jgi:hypothetical protein
MTTANTQPIFSSLGEVQWSISAMTTANTTKDLTSGTIYLVFTADTTNGGFVQRIRFRSLGTNSNATVARVWFNNGLTTSTSSNNTLFDEITLTTITGSETSATATFEVPLNIALPPGNRIYVTLGTAPTSAGWQATVIGGKY